MQTITLKIDDKVSDKFLWLLNHFSQNEIEVIEKSSSMNINNDKNIESLGGSLSKYADISQLELEEKAWEIHIADKYK